MQKAIFIPNLLRFFLTAIILMLTIIASAQSVAINNNGSAAHSSSMLDVTSTTKGLLIPRMNSANRGAIASPAEGLLVYDTDTKGFWYYTNSAWTEMPKSVNGGGAFTLPYAGSASFAGKAFSITNTNTTPGAFALHGQSGSSPSGIVPPFTSGVWGDNTDGPGIVGTSLNQNGILGIGVNDHGIRGISTFTGKAGVYGKNDAINSYGIIGEAFSTGAGVHGKTTQPIGKSGLFTNTNTSNSDTVVSVVHAGTGYGLTVNMSNAANTNNSGITVYNAGAGYGVISESQKGTAGAFVKTSNTTSASAMYVGNYGKGMGLEMLMNGTDNLFPAVNISHLGQGAGVEVALTNADNTKDVITAFNMGSGNGVNSTVVTGKAAIFENTSTTTTNETMNVKTPGKGSIAIFSKNNTTGSISDIHAPAVLIDNISKGVALKVKSLHSPSVNHGVDIEYDGQAYGLNVSAFYRGMHSTTASSSGTSIFAENSGGGVAIKASSMGFSNPAIEATNPNGTAIQGTSSTANKGGVTGINTQNNGYGVYGYSTADNGIGIYGEAGVGGADNRAGFFKSLAGSVGNAVRIEVEGTASELELFNLNASNASEMLLLHNNNISSNTRFAIFENASGEQINFYNNGNIHTNGALVVKGNKGIVRSSTSSQMRYETKATPTVASAGLAVGSTLSISVTFATAFSSVPVVSVGNINTGFSGICDELTTSITNVTTTGCTFKVTNNGSSSSGAFSGVWNLIIIGAE